MELRINRVRINRSRPVIQVKILNPITDTTNNTVTVGTKDLGCDIKNLLVYTGYGDVMLSGTITDRAHFHGNHKLLNLESFVANGNGQKEFVFRHMCGEDMCHYVFISVQNVPDESSCKICEVLFNKGMIMGSNSNLFGVCGELH